MTEDNSYSHTSTAVQRARLRGRAACRACEVAHQPRGRDPHQVAGPVQRLLQEAGARRPQSFTEDGFFRTGDLGERRADGLLKITGRAKELFKTAKGKYVAPAPIENELNAHAMVELSMVSGVGQPSAYAMVVLAESLRPKLGDPAVRAQVQAELGALLQAVNRPLADYEQLRMIVVAREPWAIENGCLTPTMKIKRSRIEASVPPQVEGWYAAQGTVSLGLSGDCRHRQTHERIRPPAARRRSRRCGAAGARRALHLHAVRRPHLADPHRVQGARHPHRRRARRGHRRLRRRCQRAAFRSAGRRRGDGRAGHHEHHHRAEERAARAIAADPDRRRRADRAAGARRAAGHRPAAARRAARQAFHQDPPRARARPGGRRGLRAGRLRRAGAGVHRMPGRPALRRGLDPPVVRRCGGQGHVDRRPCAALVSEPPCREDVRRQREARRTSGARGRGRRARPMPA